MLHKFLRKKKVAKFVVIRFLKAQMPNHRTAGSELVASRQLKHSQ